MEFQKNNLMTIGQYLSQTLTLTHNEFDEHEMNEFLLNLGKDFCNFVRDDNARRVLKKLHFDLLGMEVLFFALQRNDIKNTSMFLVRNNNAQFKVRIINGEIKEDRERFYIRDMFEVCSNFVVIDGVESMAADAARSQLESVLAKIDIPVIIQAGYLYYGDYETIDENKESYDVLDNLVNFYESIGFTNVNERIGCYEESIIMVKADHEFINKIML